MAGAPHACGLLSRAARRAQSLAGHQSAVECVAFDAAEEAVVAGAAGGTLKMFDLAAGKGARKGSAAAPCLRSLRLWERALTPCRCAAVVRTLTGHRAACAAVDFHPYGAPTLHRRCSVGPRRYIRDGVAPPFCVPF